MATTMGGAIKAHVSQAWLSSCSRTPPSSASTSTPQQFRCRAPCFPPPCGLTAHFLRVGTIEEAGQPGRDRVRLWRSQSLRGPCGSGLSSVILSTRLRGRDGRRFELGPSTFREKSSVVIQAKKGSVEAPERILAALGYILPLFDGIQYGRYFFLQYPVAENLLRPLYPLLAAYKGFPYSNFVAFFSLYLLVVRNESVSRYVRFNAMQAVVLDVLLILPTLVERTFAPSGGVGFELLIIFYNTVFLFLLACFLFGVVSCILGRTPRLPIVADAADAQVF